MKIILYYICYFFIITSTNFLYGETSNFTKKNTVEVNNILKEHIVFNSSILTHSNEYFWGIDCTNKKLYEPYLFSDKLILKGTDQYYKILYESNKKYIVKANNIFEFSNPYAAKIRKKDEITYFKNYQYNEYLGFKQSYNAKIDISSDAIIDATNFEKDYIKLRFPEKVRVIEVKNKKEELSKFKIGLLASSHALSLVSLDLWDNKKKNSEKHIKKNIYWFHINTDGKIIDEKQVQKFANLKQYASNNSNIKKKLENEHVFVYWSDYFKSRKFEKFNHFIIIKDSWASPYNGLENFANQMKLLMVKNGIIDLITTNSITHGNEYLKGLAYDFGGRFYKSKLYDNIPNDILNDYAGRINGRISKYYSSKIEKQNRKNIIIARYDEPYFQFGNLIHINQVAKFLYFFSSLEQIASQNDLMKDINLAYLKFIFLLSKMFIINSSELTSLFKENFLGFYIHPLNNISKYTTFDLLKLCNSEDGLKYISKVIESIKTIFESNSQKEQYFFIPDEIFNIITNK